MIVREATAADVSTIAAVQVASWRAAYRGIIDEDYLQNLSVDDKRSYWLGWFLRNDPSRFMRVIDDDARAVGFAVGGPARGRARGTAATSGRLGEIYVLYLLPEAQRRGWGTQLMRSMARGLRSRGMEGCVVWVLQRNHPACRFYDALGGLPAYRRRTEVGRQHFIEVGYFWKDLATLIEPPRSAPSPGTPTRTDS